MLKKCLRVVCRALFRFKIEGLEKMDFSKPSIIMPNHVSLLDAFFLNLYLPDDVHFVVNTRIAKKYSFFIKHTNHITINPLNPYSIRTMIKVVDSGKTLVIFPEGRITLTGGLMKVYDGPGYIAMKTGVRIYPLAIDGLERSKLAYTKKMWKTKLFPKVSMRIGDSFTIERQKNVSMKKQKKDASNLIYRKLKDELFTLRNKTNVNLYNEFIDAIKMNGKKFEIVEDLNGSMNYKKLFLTTNVLGMAVHKLIEKEKYIGVFMPNSIAHVALLFGLFKYGKSPAILNFSAGRQNLLDAIETANLETIITSKQFVAKGNFEELIDVLSEKVRIIYLEDVSKTITTGNKLFGFISSLLMKKSSHKDNEVVLFTSGSESKPKGVVLTHDNIFSNIQQLRIVVDFSPQDKVMNSLPMFHSFGLSTATLLPIILGIPLYLYPSPLHYKVIPELTYGKKATILFGTSTFLSGYAKYAHPYDFHKLRVVASGSEKVKDEVRNLFYDKFGLRIIEGYGITETAPILAVNSHIMYRKGTVGQIVPGVDYTLESVDGISKGGNLIVKGPNVMKGYLIHGKGFVPRDEWFNTGDVVEIDEDGFVTITSRLKMFAKIGGEMISLIDIELLAEDCFGNANFAAINVPDTRKGEKIILFTSNPGIRKDEFRYYLSSTGQSTLKMPSEIRIIEQIPLLGSGKTDYPKLKTLYNPTPMQIK